jgi:hypothetical protein
MAKVICTLPNASTEINGVKFVSHKLGMISEDVDDEVATGFATIQGYHHYDPKTKGIIAPAGPATAETAGAGSAGAELGISPLLPTPESLAAAAAAFTPVARGQLIDLLVAQQKAKPAAPASPPKLDPKVPPATTGAGAKTAPAAGTGGAPNPTF